MNRPLNGNPLAAAAGVATLKVLQRPGAYKRLAAIGGSLFERFSEIATTSELPLQILGDPVVDRGSVFGDGDPFDPSAQQRDLALRNQLEIELFNRGVFANVAAKLYVSTQHDEADVDNTAVALEQALGALGGE